MEREAFAKVMQEVLDSLPEEFRSRIRNVAVLVEDFPPGQQPILATQRNSCSGSSMGCP